MKKIILAAALFVSVFAQAQILVFDGETQLEDGETYTYNVLGVAAKMHLLVQNDTNEEINVKLKMLDIQNSDGSEVQFCYGQSCLNSAPINSVTPPGPPSVATKIPAGGNNAGDYAGYFYNQHPITNGPITYTMGLFHIDAAGVPTGDPIVTFNYKYDPTASTTDFNALAQMGIVVNNTVVNNTLDITANVNAKLEIVNINGQIVKKAAIANASQSIDLSSAAAGVYFARFTTAENKTAQVKIVKN
jgi:hypothetical protein